ncbi:adenylate cyclase [Labrys miyagiensis]|uniref:Adenylate cyclase n=1 Tax=Labrys miyagiensis TaxID=346912 RepID=A0ABQ6CHV6_9HYPH|nr:adenylate/guanylate cyclase domain-containing protein [Labrys miyagiensis]GLS19923.1 adenylate cyclase [Labrys miyagiensis]
MPRPDNPARRPAAIVGVAAERRNLTVLFVDIVGSTALATRMDPEDLREILRSFQRCCREAIEKYDGYIARYVGDGLLSYFGFPVAHEDDPERAVNAALCVLASVSSLSFAHNTHVQIRCGIATGLVIVGDLIGEGPNSEFALVGEAPNLAARLQEHAGPNQILLAEQTRSLIGESFELTDLGDRSVHGYDKPVRAWRVIRPNVVGSRFAAYRAAQLSPFVGRERELATLMERYERARSGDGQILGICGEPGIGKSRLVAHFSDRLKGDPHRILLFQCSPYHRSSPWYPVSRFIEIAAKLDRTVSNDRKLPKLEAWLKGTCGGAWRECVPFLAASMSLPNPERYPALDLAQKPQKTQALLSLLDLLRKDSARQPVVLIVEDLQWIDPSSLELLTLLAHDLRDLRVLTILTYRPQFVFPFGSRQSFASFVLNPLEKDEAIQLVQSLTPDNSLPSTMIERIVRKTDGIPLFVEEVTKVVLQDADTSQDVATIPARRVRSVPETLHDSLMARLDQVAPIKAVAQIAAVIGREFTASLLKAVAPLSAQAVKEAIAGLSRVGLLFETGQEAGETFAFKHALLRDAAYASLLHVERFKLHVRIAESLRQDFANLAETTPELIAHHYAQGEEYWQAANYWLKAGTQASKRSAFIEAIAHLQSALGVFHHLPENADRDALELKIQNSLANALIAAKGYGAGETIQAFKRARQLCERDPNGSTILAVLNGLVGIHYMRGEFEQARSVAQDLLQRAQDQQNATAMLMGYRILGMSRFAMGELREAKLDLEKAISLYDPDIHAPLVLIYPHDFKATSQVYLGLILVLLGDIDNGLGHCHEALDYAEKLNHSHTRCYVLAFVAGCYLVAGKAALAFPIAEQTIALATDSEFPQWVAGGFMVRGWARLELGRLEGAVEDIRNSIRGLEQTGRLVWSQFAHLLLARGLAETGQHAAAMELIEDIVEQIGNSEGRWYAAEVRRLRADLLAAAEAPPPDVEADYETAIAIAAEQGVLIWHLRALNALASFWRAHGRQAEARDRLLAFRHGLEGQVSSSERQRSTALLASLDAKAPF